MAGDPNTLLHPALAGRGVKALREVSLVVVRGEPSGTTFGPFSQRVSVGSARSNDVMLPDPTVSRFHFALARQPEGLLVTDLGSRNGTFIGAHRIREVFVEDGHTIRLGDTELRVAVAREAKLEEVEATPSFGGLVGVSAAMLDLYALLRRLAAAEVPVLVEGETGTGKELVARALHTEGRRAAGPFVVMDCGAVAPTLVESELFGHERGAFSGAERAHRGVFERAQGGSVFLDEIGELPLALQPKLLRVLEAKTVKPLGAESERSVDVRVIAATHRDLRRMVNDGTFREDLYFRLGGFPVRVPPLRERREDIELLAAHFIRRALSALEANEAPALTPETRAWLRGRTWPGNVRELKNAMERAVVLGDLEAIQRGDLTGSLASTRQESEPESTTLEEAKRRFERGYLVALLARHDGDKDLAAAEAGVHPKSIERLLRRHGLRRS